MLGNEQKIRFSSPTGQSGDETKHPSNRHFTRHRKADVNGNARNCSENPNFLPVRPNRRVKPCTTSAISAAGYKPSSAGSPPSSPSFASGDWLKNSATTGTKPSREGSPLHDISWMEGSRPSSPHPQGPLPPGHLDGYAQVPGTLHRRQKAPGTPRHRGQPPALGREARLTPCLPMVTDGHPLPDLSGTCIDESPGVGVRASPPCCRRPAATRRELSPQRSPADRQAAEEVFGLEPRRLPQSTKSLIPVVALVAYLPDIM